MSTSTPPTNPPKGDQAFRIKDRHEKWQEMTYAGALSFLRRQYTRDVETADVVVSGVPFDNATTYRPGCRFGPQAIRAASVQLAELDAFPYGFDPFASLSVIDYGDCFIDPHQPTEVAATITAHAEHILQQSKGVKMLTFGGDHFVSYPLLKAHAKRYGPLALVQFDAHCDTWEDEPNRIDHGTMFARAVSEGLVDVSHSIQVGLRTHNEVDYGFQVLSSPWIHRNGVDAVSQAIVERVGNCPVYVSFDIDVLDPAFSPGTGTPVVGGLASWQAIELIQGLKSCTLVGMDIVEVSPPYDHSEITALAAATMGYQWLCLLAQQKSIKRPN